MLRLLTYLAPSLPIELFTTIARYLTKATGITVTVQSETRHSGPPRGSVDPFSAGMADLGFLCSPAYLWMHELAPPSVELLPFAFAPLDPRAAGRPVYFSDVIVRRDDLARSFDDLAGRVWAYNDTCSRSGYFCVLEKLAKGKRGRGFFDHMVEAGSHLASIALVSAGAADASAIDSNVLALALGRDPALAASVRVVESWGPFSIQPAVVRAALDPSLKTRIAAALAALATDDEARTALGTFGFSGFAPINASAYHGERMAIAACEHLHVAVDRAT